VSALLYAVASLAALAAALRFVPRPAPPPPRGRYPLPFARRRQPPYVATVCAWCPDVEERTADARSHGLDVSHTICPSCEARERGALGGWGRES